jgi:hypothetical protein
MHSSLLLCAAAAVLVAAGTETAAPASHAAQSIAFTRLDTGRLEGLEPGTALIRDSVAWRTLWWYFGREYRSEWNAPLPDSIATPPPVDFTRNVIVAVSSRVFSGCGGPYISRVEADGPRLRVVLGPAEDPEFPMICTEEGSGLEAVLVPGRWRQVSVVGPRPEYIVPPPARWWTKPSVEAALDTGRSVLKDVSWRVLPRDSKLSLKDLRRLARGASDGAGPSLGLLGNPRVKASPELLTILGSGRRASRLAQALLFQLHGDALAGDRGADTTALAIVIAGLRDADHPDVARLLAHNRTVRRHEALLRGLIREVRRDSVTCSVALEAYASRWPLQHEFPSSGPPDRGRAYEVVGCEGPPDLTRRELPSVRVVHACGTTFRIRNELTTASDITWDVPETGESGRVVLPPRGRRPYREMFLTTASRGTLRLYRDGRMFTIIGNSGGRPCAASDTIPPIVPLARLFFPDDTARSVVPASDSTVRYYRTLMQVTFYDTTGGDQVRSAMEHWRSTIVAGGPYPTPYLLRLRDPGSTWSAFDSLLVALRDQPGVQDVFPVTVRERVRP